MKKAVAILSLCALAGTSAFADGSSTVKKNYKDMVYKDAAPAKKYHWMDNLSGNLALTSNYIFRGISQSENLPALQGGFTYTFPIKLYLSVWGSNVKFASTPSATLELDTIMGYSNDIGENFTYDINVARYNYPRARILNYNEINTKFDYRFLRFGVSYSGNVFNVH